MSDFTTTCDLINTAAVRSVGLKVGDFINYAWTYSYVWAEVVSVYENSCSVCCGRRRHNSDYVFFHNINYIHRKDDLWDDNEVRIMSDRAGHYGNRESTLPLPEKYLYQGTYRIQPWLWNYCGQNVTPKISQNLQSFLDLHGLPGHNVPWNEAWAVCRKLEEKRIKGWHPICRPIAEQHYGKTIAIKPISHRIWNTKSFSEIPQPQWAKYDRYLAAAY
jgi:hypothetical protein